MDKREVSHALEEIALLLELSGENPFKIRAYKNAARAILNLAGDLGEAVSLGTLEKIKGVGEQIASKVSVMVQEGSLPYLERLRSSFPQGVYDMVKIPGLGPKRIRLLVDTMGITSLSELEEACKENRLLEHKGFGAKTQAKILKGIEGLATYAGQFLAFNALREAQEILRALWDTQAASQLALAGSLRRCKETVKDIDIVAAGQAEALMDALASHPLVKEVGSRGPTKMQVTLHSAIPLDLRVVQDQAFPFTLQHFTGSKAHNVALRERAVRRGIKSNEYGLFEGERSLACEDEAAVYRALGLEYIPPELREDLGEIEAAERNALPRLIQAEDIRGALHIHTSASDGVSSLEEVVGAARALGLSYVGLTEHSQSATYARGLDLGRLEEESQRIRRFNDQSQGFRVLHGAEVDILPDGSLDYPDEVLESLDFVVASIHTHFTMTAEEMTRRICTAIRNPYLDILGHPTGRLLLTRDPYPVNMEEVLRCLADQGKAVEFNAHPYRLDLDWRLMSMARSLGVKIALCPDAHGAADLVFTLSSLGTLRKGWITPQDVLSCMDVQELISYILQRRKEAGGKA